MKPVSRGFVLMGLPLIAMAAPDVDEILMHVRKALGDVGAVRAITIKGTRAVSTDGPEGLVQMNRASQVDYELPDKYRRAEKLALPDGLEGPTILEGLDGGVAWNEVRGGGEGVIIRTMPPPGVNGDGPEADAARARMSRNNFHRNMLVYTLTAPAGSGVQFRLVGEKDWKQAKAWEVEATGPNGFAARYWIDQRSHLPVRVLWRGLLAPRPVMRVGLHGDSDELQPERPAPVEVEYDLTLDGYQAQGPIRMPAKTTLSVGGKVREEFTLEHVVVNGTFPPRYFSKP